MSIKKTLCMLIAFAMISPMAMAKKKKEKSPKSSETAGPAAVKFVSITEENIVVSEKGKEKTYTITEDTKIFNKDGEEVGVADVDFTDVVLDIDANDAKKVTKITEAKEVKKSAGASAAAAKKAKKDAKKKKK